MGGWHPQNIKPLLHNIRDFWDTQPREGEGMTEEEVEKMMKQKDRCTIS